MGRYCLLAELQRAVMAVLVSVVVGVVVLMLACLDVSPRT